MTASLPSGLNSPSVVGVYSPSGAISNDKETFRLFNAGIARIEQLGFTVRESTHCRSAWYQMSAPAADRVSDINELVSDPDVDVIIPTIGGHAADQLLPFIDFQAIAASGKALFGFSDNSTLPLITSATTGAITFHTGCDVTYGFGRFADGAYQQTEAGFIEAIRHHRFDLRGTGGWQAVQPGRAQGTLLGGNLHAMLRLAGTPRWPDWRGKIMFWEGVDELHAIEQGLVQLSLMGAFDELAGMIIGRVSNLPESLYPRDQVAPLDTLLLDIIGLRGKFPIIKDADIGHNAENVTIPVGAEATLGVAGDAISCAVAAL
jgi:muramoyltetrapeptide carboxypeptidase